MFGYGFWLSSANFGLGLWCVCFGLGFFCTPLFLARVLGRVPSCAAPPVPRHPRRGAVWGSPLAGFLRPPLFFCGLPGRWGGSVGVVLGAVVLWLGGGGRRLSPSWPPWSPPPHPPSFGFPPLFFVCVLVAGGLLILRQGCAPAFPGCPYLRPFGGCVALVGRCFPLGVFGLVRVPPRCPISWPCGCRLWWCLAQVRPPLWGGCAVVRWSPPYSFCPVGQWLCFRGWVGLPPFCVSFSIFLGGRGLCLFLPLPSLGWCTH